MEFYEASLDSLEVPSFVISTHRQLVRQNDDWIKDI